MAPKRKASGSSNQPAKKTKTVASDAKKVEKSDFLKKPSDSAKKAGNPSDYAKKAGKPSDSAKKAGNPSDSAKKAGNPSDSAKKAGKPSDSAKKAGKPSNSAKKAGKLSDSAMKAGKPSDSAKRAGKPSDSAKKADKPSDSAKKAGKPSDSAKKVEKIDTSKKLEKPAGETNQASGSKNVGNAKADKPDASRQVDAHYPVDSLVPTAISYSVVADWTCTLNQTNIGDNNNKFYLIQLLRDSQGAFSTWNRWGRVGETGQSKLSVFGFDLAAAEKDFCKKFTDKTRNVWAKRSEFKAISGKYTLVEMEKCANQDMDGDAPLGQLSEAQIHKGSSVLKDLRVVLESEVTPSVEIARLSGHFYSLIPHVFGRNRPPPLDTLNLVEEKGALLEFYLRMGFSGIEVKNDPSPIPGVRDLVPPKSLGDAIAGRGLCSKGDIDAANSKGLSCQKKNAGNPVRAMPPHLYAAIVLYTGNSIYRDLNTSLRERKLSKCLSYKPYVRSLIEACESLPATATSVWRGLSVDLFSEYTVGKEMTWWQVSSCTSCKEVALNFAKNCGSESTLLTINTKSARNISCVTFYPNEQENILLPGIRVKVVSKQRAGGMTCITLEETGSAL